MRPNPSWPAITRRTVLVAALLAGCGGPTPSPAPASVTPAPPTTQPSQPPIDDSIAGLVLATGGPLQVTTDGGDLVPFEPATQPVVQVLAGGGLVVTVDRAGEVEGLGPASAGAWTPLELPDAGARLRLIALAPDGERLAIVLGDPSARTFDLIVQDLPGGARRRFAIPSELNGAPAWIGRDRVVVDVIGRDEHSALIAIDPATGSTERATGPGTIATASADGRRIAVDDPESGAAWVGDTAAWEATGRAKLHRLDGPAGTFVEAVALSPDGSRLAIVRSRDGGAVLETLVGLDGSWQLARRLDLRGDGPRAIAWTR